MSEQKTEQIKNMVLTFKTHLLPDFEEKLKSANKKLEKFNYQITELNREITEKKVHTGIFDKYITITLDTPVFVKNVKGHEPVEEYDENGLLEIKEVATTYSVEEGLKFSMKGYEYLGTIKRKAVGQEYEYSSYSVSERNIQKDLKSWEGCDHCKRNIYRNRYHLFEKDGKVVQIGSSCAKEYFGLDIMRLVQVWEKETTEFWGYEGGSFQYDYTWTPKEIMFYGFQLAGFHEGWDKGILSGRLNFTRNTKNEKELLAFQEKNEKFISEYGEKIELAYEQIYSETDAIDPMKANNFEQNLIDALFISNGENREYTTKTGIVGWKAFDTFTKMIKEKAPSEENGIPERNDEPIAEFTQLKCKNTIVKKTGNKGACGKVQDRNNRYCAKCQNEITRESGELIMNSSNLVSPRLTQKAKVTFKTMGESTSAFSEYWYLIKFVNENNQEIVWFTSKESVYDEYEKDKEYTITFSIKEHKQYNGHFSTNVNRVKKD